MTEIKALGLNGFVEFEAWLLAKNAYPFPEQAVFDDEATVPELRGAEVNQNVVFQSRFAWAKHLVNALGNADQNFLLSEPGDRVWAWISGRFISQLTKGFKQVRDPENYIVTRNGVAGSIIHRNAPRTSYILYKEHGERSVICLDRPMWIRGEMTELLTATQGYFRHKGFFELAHRLYYGPEGLKKSFSSRPDPVGKRIPGNQKGAGGVYRLIKFLDKLDYNFDTLAMDSTQMKEKLPKEFKRFLN